MDTTHKELSDKEIALELTKLVKTSPNSARESDEEKSMRVVKIYNSILKELNDLKSQH